MKLSAASEAEEAGAVVTIPSPQSRSDDGEVTFASAPGIADEFRTELTRLAGIDPLPKAAAGSAARESSSGE